MERHSAESEKNRRGAEHNNLPSEEVRSVLILPGKDMPKLASEVADWVMARQYSDGSTQFHIGKFHEAVVANYFAANFPKSFRYIVIEKNVFTGLYGLSINFNNGREVVIEDANEYKEDWVIAKCAMVSDLVDA